MMDGDSDRDDGERDGNADGDGDGLSTCQHGLRYDPSQHLGCVVCRREAGIPSTMPAPAPASESGAAKGIYIAIGALVMLVGVGVATTKFLRRAPEDQTVTAGEGLPVAFEPASSAEAPVGSSELLAEAGRLEAARRAEENRRAAEDREYQEAERAQAIDRASESVVITMYTTSWCPVCVRAKEFMAAEGIRYTERNVENSETARAACLRLNPRCSVPTIDIDGEVLIGFSAGGIQAAIGRAAEHRL